MSDATTTTVTYWDSSAIINAAISAAVLSRLDAGTHFTRLHGLNEFFALTTGRGVPMPGGARFKFSQDDCAVWLRRFCEKVQLIELDKAEILDALDKARSCNFQGGHIYDYVHALAADKAKAEELLTRNIDDFLGLTKAKVQWP